MPRHFRTAIQPTLLRAPAPAAAAAAAFLPSSVSGLKGWYDASILSTADATEITTWPDSSGNGKDLAGVTTTTGIVKTGIQNNLRIVRFDGTDDVMTSATFGTFAQPNMVFVVAKGTTTGQQMALFDSISGTAHAVSIDSRAGQGINIRTTATIKADDTIAAFKIYQCYFNNTTSYVSVNGTVVVGPGTIGTSALTNLSVGKGGTSTFWGSLGGDIGEILVYNADVSAANATSIRTYLGTKWNITTI